LIGNRRVRSLRTPPASFLRRGRRVPLSNQRDFVGFGQGSDARFLLNQVTSDFALLDFPLTFQDEFFGTKIKKFPDPCIYSIRSATSAE
jgi:hypothetical protein